MPLTTNYVHYKQENVCNVVASGSCNLVAVDSTKCAVAAAEDVHLLNLRTGALLCVYEGRSACTQLAMHEDARRLAVGHRDGRIRLFSTDDYRWVVGLLQYTGGSPKDCSEGAEPVCTFAGHRTSVSSLCFAPQTGLSLVSGGQDCAVVVWDLVGETGQVKLLGHKGAITRVLFTHNQQFVISSSKDTFIKLWCVASQSCFYTIADHKTEVYDMCLYANDARLVCGSAELELRVYDLFWTEGSETSAPAGDDQQSNLFVRVRLFGCLLRNTKGRTHQLCLSDDQQMLVAVGANQNFDMFRIYTAADAHKRIAKKLKHARKQLVEGTSLPAHTEAAIKADLSAHVQRLATHKCQDKIKAVMFAPLDSRRVDDYRLMAVLGNNAVECLSVAALKSGQLAFERLDCSCNERGHRTHVRAAAFSQDSAALLTASKESVKMWNRESMACVLSMPVQEAVCCAFIAADNYCVVGTRSGSLVIYSTSSGQICDDLTEAHQESVNALCLSPDLKGCVTASADKTVKFWEFDRKVSASGAACMSAVHRRTLQLPDQAHAVVATPKFIVVGLLNSNALVYFADSLKLFLTLHGHSLPVLAVDVSSDERLVLTGSADKNVKVWGLDFGDCRKSLFAHDDSVTCVKFVPDSTLFFTAGKDGVIKQWDADNFEQVQVLKKHTEQIWALALSQDGRRLLSASHDRTVRLWLRTDELLVLEEEQQQQREDEYAEQLQDSVDVIPGESTVDSIALASRRTLLSVKSIETVIEAVDIVRAERLAQLQGDADHRPHPLLAAMDVHDLDNFIADVFRKIRASELERALLQLPQSMLCDVMQALTNCIRRGYQLQLCTTVVLFLCRVFFHQIISDPKAQAVVDVLRKDIGAKLTECKDTVGFNLAALRLLKWEVEERNDVQLFMEANELTNKKQKKRKAQLEHDLADRIV